MTNEGMNKLYFGDCLEVKREEIPDANVDLIYLDAPFNSKRIYNASMGGAQWDAFNDTWQWHEAIDDFHDVARDPHLAPTLEGLRTILGEGPDLAYLSYMANRLRECHRELRDTGSMYLHYDPKINFLLRTIMDGIFGRNNFRNEIVWSYKRWPSKSSHFRTMHDIILYCAGRSNTFHVPIEKASESHLRRFKGRTQILDPERKTRKIPVDKPNKGLPQCAVWNISILAGSSKERMGYPTQKPLALLDRTMAASSNAGDVVLDPFCGCGTTIHAAQNLGRQWNRY